MKLELEQDWQTVEEVQVTHTEGQASYYEFIVQKSSCEPIPPSGLSTMVKLLIGIGAGAAVIGGAALLVRWHSFKLKIQKDKEKMIANSRYLNVFQRD